jgi:hypothetical protein
MHIGEDRALKVRTYLPGKNLRLNLNFYIIQFITVTYHRVPRSDMCDITAAIRALSSVKKARTCEYKRHSDVFTAIGMHVMIAPNCHRRLYEFNPQRRKSFWFRRDR